MIPPMRFVARSLIATLLLPLFTQCGSKSAPDTNAVTGPFDNRGDYIEDWADSPEKWYHPKAEKKKSKSRIAKKENTPPPRTEAPRPTLGPTPTVEAPKPKPVVVKPKPQPKPKPKPKPVVVRHTVRKGDTLSGLARKYGSSISKIKSANRISGTVIRLGQTLTIPK